MRAGLDRDCPLGSEAGVGAGLVALIRRALVAVLTGMAVAAAIRLRVRRRAVPPQTGGWRELRDDELTGGAPHGAGPAGGELTGGEPSGGKPSGAEPLEPEPAVADPADAEPTGDEASAERG